MMAINIKMVMNWGMMPSSALSPFWRALSVFGRSFTMDTINRITAIIY